MLDNICPKYLPLFPVNSFAIIVSNFPQICVHVRGEREHVSSQGGRGLRLFVFRRLPSPLLFFLFCVSFSTEHSRSFRGAPSNAYDPPPKREKRRIRGFSSLTAVDGCFQFSKFPSFSCFPISLKHRREKKECIKSLQCDCI